MTKKTIVRIPYTQVYSEKPHESEVTYYRLNAPHWVCELRRVQFRATHVAATIFPKKYMSFPPAVKKYHHFQKLKILYANCVWNKSTRHIFDCPKHPLSKKCAPLVLHTHTPHVECTIDDVIYSAVYVIVCNISVACVFFIYNQHFCFTESIACSFSNLSFSPWV